MALSDHVHHIGAKKKKKNWSEKHILKIMFVLKTVILLPIHEMYKM